MGPFAFMPMASIYSPGGRWERGTAANPLCSHSHVCSEFNVPRQRMLRFWLTVLLSALVLGCGHSSVATVSGEVTYEGEPVMDGMITFIPADGKGPVVGGRI